MKKDQLSYSALSSFAKSPNHLLAYWQDDVIQTPAMLFGKLVHKLILEPETLENEYAIYEGRRAGKVWDSFKFDNSDKNIVTDKEFNTANLVFNKAKENKLFMSLMMRTNETEKHIKWNCDGIKYHGYVDIIKCKEQCIWRHLRIKIIIL